MNQNKIWAFFLIFLIVSVLVTARPQAPDLDLVERDTDGAEPNPGWVRRQLIRAGEAASRVGSGLGGYALRLTNLVDRVCGVIKKIIPIVGAVCTVGQFKFCALDNPTYALEAAGIPQTDVEALDK